MPRLKFIEHAEIHEADDLDFNLYRDGDYSADWYILVESPGSFFLSDLAHVADVIRQTFMVDADSWRVLNIHQEEAGAVFIPPNSPKTDWAVLYDNNKSYALLLAITNSPSLINK